MALDNLISVSFTADELRTMDSTLETRENIMKAKRSIYFLPMRIFWLVCLITIESFAIGQKISITGKVIDNDSNEPVFGVALIYRNTPVTFSDDRGHFTLQLENASLNDSISFKHLSYILQPVPLERLQSDSVIRLHNCFYNIDAVTVQPIDHKKLVKAIVVQFQQSAPSKPYWSNIRQTQILTCKGNLSGFLEYTGKMLCMGRSIKNAFIENKWYPEHIRRTKEEYNFAMMMNDWYRLRMGEAFTNFAWTEYRFFDIAHPLGKYHKHFVFNVDSSVIVNYKNCWSVSFRQKDPINVSSWPLLNMSGYIYVDKVTDRLVQISSSFSRGTLSSSQINVAYGTCNSWIIPKEIDIAIIRNKTEKGSRIQQKVLIENKVVFISANILQKKQYKGEYNSFKPELIIPKMSYTSEYWTSFTSEWDNMWKDIQFIEGAQEQIFRDGEISESSINWSQQAQQQIETEIKTIEWKDIN